MGTLRGAPSEGQVTDPRVMREVIVTARALSPAAGFRNSRYPSGDWNRDCTLWMRRQFPQFPLPALPFPDHLIGPPHQRYEIIVRPYGRRRPVILSRRKKKARNGVSNFSARRLLAATEEPIAGRSGGAGERRRWRCCARSVDVDEHDADPFSTKVGLHTPQHCSGLSSDNGASAAVSALKGALALVAESTASFVA